MIPQKNFSYRKNSQKNLFLGILLCSIANGCVTVRPEDLNAWQNVPVIELEMHPIFNAMELEKKPLSDGSTLWSFTKRGGTFQNCSSNSQSNATSVTKERSQTTNSYDRHGYDSYGYDRHGYNRYGYDKHGYNKYGYDKTGRKRTEVTQSQDSSYTNSNCVSGEYVCVNQFLVNKQGMVVWYHPTGNSCYTDCSYRPFSRPCPP